MPSSRSPAERNNPHRVFCPPRGGSGSDDPHPGPVVDLQLGLLPLGSETGPSLNRTAPLRRRARGRWQSLRSQCQGWGTIRCSSQAMKSACGAIQSVVLVEPRLTGEPAARWRRDSPGRRESLPKPAPMVRRTPPGTRAPEHLEGIDEDQSRLVQRRSPPSIGSSVLNERDEVIVGGSASTSPLSCLVIETVKERTQAIERTAMSIGTVRADPSESPMSRNPAMAASRSPGASRNMSLSPHVRRGPSMIRQSNRPATRRRWWDC